MERKYIDINVINYDTIPNEVDMSKYGRHLSTRATINSNKIGPDRYSVIYTKSEFMELDPARFVASLINVFKKNIPGYELSFCMEIIKKKSEELGDVNLIDHMHMVKVLFYEVIRTNRVTDVTFTIGNEFMLDAEYIHEKFDDEEDDEDEAEYDDEYDEDEENPFDQIMGVYREKNKKKEYYGRSRVFKDSKNPRKEFNRHGVIIADSKSDVEKDLKIIKEFLKDFIPGKQGWKKEIRKELAQRWVHLYTVTKKQLKELEHETRKHASDKRKVNTTKKALRFTKKLFTVPIDLWSDPNK